MKLPIFDRLGLVYLNLILTAVALGCAPDALPDRYVDVYPETDGRQIFVIGPPGARFYSGELDFMLIDEFEVPVGCRMRVHYGTSPTVVLAEQGTSVTVEPYPDGKRGGFAIAPAGGHERTVECGGGIKPPEMQS